MKLKKILGMKNDSPLNFTEHLSNDIIRNVNRKVKTLSEITANMNMAKQRVLMNSYSY